MRRTAIVMMAGFGDIINILPAAQIIGEQDGQPPTMYVLPNRMSLFESVSYVRPVSADPKIRPSDLAEHIRPKYDRVLLPQPCGEGIAYERRCNSFTKEAWDRCGMLPFFGRRMPVFDQRNKKRELRLVWDHIVKSCSNILVNLSGLSSPYPHADWLWKRLRNVGGNVHFINLAGVTSRSIVDLLGLFEEADGLITTDTATLHLASASNIPTAALIVDTPTLWHGSIPLKTPELSISYGESRSRIETLLDWVHEKAGVKKKIFHVHSAYEGKGDEVRRNELARSTWSGCYKWSLRSMPVTDDQLPQLFNDGNRRLPFINDVIDFAFENGAPWVMLTNTDTCFGPNLMNEVWSKIDNGYHAIWAHRRDFSRLERELTSDEIKAGDHYPGTDLFVMKRSWWREFRSEMPDMVLGAEAWDCLLRELMREKGGVEIKDVIYHERHESRWETSENRYTLPSQHYCLARAKEFFEKRGIDPSQFGIK